MGNSSAPPGGVGKSDVIDSERRQSSRRFWGVVVFFFVVNVLGIVWVQQTWAPNDTLRVQSVSPQKELWTSDEVCITFDRAVVDPQGVSRVLIEPPATWQPEVPGEWLWLSTHRLAFRPHAPISGLQPHMLRLAEDFGSRYARRLFGERVFRFEAQPLQLLGWRLDSADPHHVNLELRFNQAVSPVDLAAALSAFDPQPTGAGRSLPLEVLSPSASTRHWVRGVRPAGGSIGLQLKGGLRGVDGSVGLAKTQQNSFSIPNGLHFLGSYANTPGSQRRVRVELRFSEALLGTGLPDVHIDPPVESVHTRSNYTRLIIEGEFEPSRSYSIVIDPGLESQRGSVTAEGVTTRVTIPDRDPTVSIPFSSGVLSPQGHREVEVDVANVSGVVLSATRVYPNNLVAHLRGTRSSLTSREVVSKRVSLDIPRNELRHVVLDLEELLPEGTGIYEVKVESTQDRWVRDSVVVCLTDVALTAKIEKQRVLAWVTTVDGGQPLEGVEVSAISTTNQVLDVATTDVRGWVELSTPDGHPDGDVWLLSAVHGEQLSYLRLDNHRWSVEGVDSDGRPATRGYDAHVYAERGVYRAGETVYLSGVLRDAHGEIPPALPLELVLKSPLDRVLSRTALECKGGCFQIPLPLPEDAILGDYAVGITLAKSEQFLGTTRFAVEAFMPQHLELSVVPQNPHSVYLDLPRPTVPQVHFDVESKYLSGRPAAGLVVRGSAKLYPRKLDVVPEGYVVDPIGKKAPERELPSQQIELDEQGRGQLSFELPHVLPLGLWEIETVVTVTETGGRSLSTRATARIDTTAKVVALSRPEKVIAPNEELSIGVRFFDGAGGAADPVALDVRLILERWHSVLREVGDRWSWQSEVEEEIITEFAIGDGQPLQVQCPWVGRYRLQVMFRDDDGIEFGSEIRFYVAAPGEQHSVSLAQAETLQLVPTQDSFSPGEEARILVRAPFPGTLCLTLEDDRVVSKSIVELTEGTAECAIAVPKEVRGDLFVCATLVRPIDLESAAWLPIRSFGAARLRIDRSQQQLMVAIESPPLLVPGEEVTLRVNVDSHSGATERLERPAEKLGDGLADSLDTDEVPCQVQLWGVDEGILRLTGYQGADPIDTFWGARRWEVASCDVFGDLLPDFQRGANLTRIGGGDGGPLARRSMEPIAFKESVVVVKPWLRCDGATLEVPIIVPEHQGQIRWYAVAVQGDRYGIGELGTVVRSPLSLQVSLPRFLAPGDVVEVPVKCFNNTEDRLTVALNATVTAPARLVAGADSGFGVDAHALQVDSLEIAAGSSATHWLRVAAAGDVAADVAAGTAQLRVEAHVVGDAPALISESSTPLTVRPSSHFAREQRLFRVLAGEEARIVGADGFSDGEVAIKVSGAPQLSLEEAYREVLEYPYGCAEQTTSRLWGILYAPDTLIDTEQRRNKVQAGVARLFSMQDSQGGIGYWPGESGGQAWLSAYCADALVECRELGFEVPAEFLEPLLDALQQALHRGLEAPQRAYVAAILARSDRNVSSWLAQLSEHCDDLDLAARAHVMLGWCALGQRDRARQLLRGGDAKEDGSNGDDSELLEQRIMTSNSPARLTSQLTQEALLLRALIEVDRDHGWIPTLAQRLSLALRNQRRSTLENGACIRALYHYQRARRVGEVRAEVTISGEPAHTLSGAEVVELLPSVVASAGGEVHVSNTGTAPVYCSVVTQGMRSDDAVREHDRGLEVRRRWLDAKGNELGALDQPLRVGDLIQVEVSLRLLDLAGENEYDSLANVVIVDPIPAGVEGENPRLLGSAVGRSQSADRVEFLDDRVITFATARRTPSVFRYALRVTTVGEYSLPPIQAESMYDPGYSSIRAGVGGKSAVPTATQLVVVR